LARSARVAKRRATAASPPAAANPSPALDSIARRLPPSAAIGREHTTIETQRNVLHE
jgi:hypothetical protein